jgi:hypothetical protein
MTDPDEIIAPGTDLADGDTHGPGGADQERNRSPRTENTDGRMPVGIGGATDGQPAHATDPAVPPGRRPSPAP